MNKNVPKLRFEGFNDKWRATKLGEVIDYKKGFAFKSKDYADNGIRVIKISDTTTSSVSEEGNIFVKFEMFEEFKEWALKTEDIIISTVGSRPPLYSSMVGKVVKIPEFCNGSLLNQNLVKLVPKDIINMFLYSLLKKTRYTKHIENICRGNANQVSITLEELFDFNVNIPSLQEQEKIADFFTILDSLIEEQDGKVSDLELYKKGMMQKIFSQEIRFKDENGCDYPEWEEKLIGEVCNISTGKRDTKNKVENGKYPFFVRSQTIEKIDSYSFDGEAILTAGDGVGVGKVFHYVNCKFDYHQRVYKLSNFEFINVRYLYEYFSKNFKREVNKYNAKTSVDSVRLEMITKMKIPYPCLQEQIKIADFLSNIDNLIEKEKKNLDDLREMKKGLLQQMFV